MISIYNPLHNKLICVLLALFFSIIPVLFFITFFTEKSISFETKIKLAHSGEIKLYCSSSEKNNFENNVCVISKKLKAGKNTSLRARIKAPQIKLIRLEISAPAGDHEISAMTLRGTQRLRAKHFKVLNSQKMTPIQSGKKKIILKTRSTNSAVTFYATKAVYSQKQLFTPGTFICLILCTLVFSFVLIKLDSAGKLKNKQDVFLVYLFIGMLFIPCWKLDTSAELLTENRKKALFPHFFTPQQKINNNFGREMDKWFSDRFFGRNELIALWQKLLSYEDELLNISKSGKVFKGNDGWYFYTGDDAMKNFMNAIVFTPRELKEHLKNLTALNNFCKANGICFYYFIAPDKHRIYGEAISSFTKERPDSESRAAQWVNYIRKNSDIKVIYPVDELKKRKKYGLLYYKTDSHWNRAGAYYGYLELCKVLKKDFPDLPLFSTQKTTVKHHLKGDLQLLSPATVPEDKYAYKIPYVPQRYKTVKTGKLDYKFTNSKGRYSLLLLRDSFAIDLLPFLGNSFKQIDSFWQYTLPEKVIRKLNKEKPDILILEHVERFLPIAMEAQFEHLPFLKSGEK